jgi:hypothetical protein
MLRPETMTKAYAAGSQYNANVQDTIDRKLWPCREAALAAAPSARKIMLIDFSNVNGTTLSAHFLHNH